MELFGSCKEGLLTGNMGEGDRSRLGKIIAMTRIIGRFTPDVSHVWNVDHRLSVCLYHSVVISEDVSNNFYMTVLRPYPLTMTALDIGYKRAYFLFCSYDFGEISILSLLSKHTNI